MLATLAAIDFFMRRLAFPGLVLNRSVRTSVDTLQNLLLKGRTKSAVLYTLVMWQTDAFARFSLYLPEVGIDT